MFMFGFFTFPLFHILVTSPSTLLSGTRHSASHLVARPTVMSSVLEPSLACDQRAILISRCERTYEARLGRGKDSKVYF